MTSVATIAGTFKLRKLTAINDASVARFIDSAGGGTPAENADS